LADIDKRSQTSTTTTTTARVDVHDWRAIEDASLDLTFLEAYQVILQWHVLALSKHLALRDDALACVVDKLWFGYLETRQTRIAYLRSKRRRVLRGDDVRKLRKILAQNRAKGDGVRKQLRFSQLRQSATVNDDDDDDDDVEDKLQNNDDDTSDVSDKSEESDAGEEDDADERKRINVTTLHTMFSKTVSISI
jgi:hypothetical protein